MSTYDKSALERCRTQIVKDLDIRHIVDDLIATNVIDENHYDLIKNQVRSFLLLYNGGKVLCIIKYQNFTKFYVMSSTGYLIFLA